MSRAAAPSSSRTPRSRTKAQTRASRRKRAARPSCTCMNDGGFAEHLPMEVWKKVMRSQSLCAVHGTHTRGKQNRT